METNRSHNQQPFATVLTFLAGAAVGALLVVLTVPGAGGNLERLGGRIKRKAGHLADQAKEAGEDVVDQATGG